MITLSDWRRTMGAGVAVLAMLQPAVAAKVATVEIGPTPAADVQLYITDLRHEPKLTRVAKIKLLREKVKYVFVLFQENRSFDSYFATFPGARGLFSQPPDKTLGFTQPIMNVDGSMGTIQPFRIGPAEFAADTDDVDHSYVRMAAKMDIRRGVPHMDRFALEEEKKYVTGDKPSLKAKQYGELAMAYADCDTVPFLWQYASHFTLFDNFFQHTIGPSTPGAIALIAGQTGETQWVKHPTTDSSVLPDNAAKGIGEPVVTDANPFWGSALDASAQKLPYNPRANPNQPQLNQTYASLPLSLGGSAAADTAASDRNAATDLPDVQRDLKALAASKTAPVPWGWYQEGYDRESTDPATAAADGTHTGYVTHHNAPQYFGYVANNPKQSAKLHGLGDFFATMKDRTLPGEGGVFYVRGGYTNIAGLVPADSDPEVQKKFLGDDDHPGYSDSHISEALVAAEINAIARSPYWAQSAIIITYDESEGDYDHVPPLLLETAPSKLALSRGPRIPLILVSPFARVHAISHESGDHSSVIRFIDTVFDLTALADLPDEVQARKDGERMFGQKHLGPSDARSPGVDDLLSAFDNYRLLDKAPPAPAALAEIPDKIVQHVPPYDNKGCQAIGIVPTDIALGIKNSIPADFNPRPATNPTAQP
jgi:phospholipase C